MYQIKQIPEDFVVREISNVEISDKGRFLYFILKKKNYTTLRAIGHISQQLKIPVKRFGFAGTKDKQAVTEQLVSVSDVSKERLENIKLRDITLNVLGFGDKPISLGDLKGNEFEIVIRNLDDLEIKKLKNKNLFSTFRVSARFVAQSEFSAMRVSPRELHLALNKYKNKTKLTIPNYYGEQRFSKHNHMIGKAIIKKDFKKAVELILESEGDVENLVKGYLEKNPTNYVSALRIINKKLLLMYVHAFQSYLFNLTLTELLKDEKNLNNKKNNTLIPVVGFGSELEGEVGDLIKDLLKKEKITQRDFIIRSIPELSSEGDTRQMFVEVKDFKLVEEGKDFVKVSFSLPKGSYATVVVTEMLNIHSNC